jgi:acyl-CoA thioester hydrolase
MAQHFEWPVRVYYEDTDAGGIVYHTMYLNFMERARSEWLRALGFEQDDLMRDDNRLFAVRRIEVEYVLPARFNDQLLVTVAVTRLGRASMDFYQEIRRAADALLLCSARIKIACLDARLLRPGTLPKRLLTEIQRDL